MSPEEASKPQPYITCLEQRTDSQSPSGVCGFVMPLSTLYKWIPETILKVRKYSSNFNEGFENELSNFPK